MGRGVFCMPEPSRTVIIPFDHYLPDDLTDADLCWIYFEDAVGTILGALPRSYEDCWIDGRAGGIWDGRYTRIIARNGFVNVGLTEWECNDLFVSFYPRDNDDRYEDGINPLAYHAYESAYHHTIAGLQRFYELRVRTSGYTTAPLRAAA